VYESNSLMWSVIYFFGVVVFTAALAMLIALLWSKATQRIANAIVVNPIGTGGFGCLTLIVLPGLLLLVAITIILSPLSLLGFLLMLAAILVGWTAINLEVGNRLARLFKVEWSAPVAAGIGALVFNLVIFSLGMIPCIGWALFILVLLFALGGVLVTRFGSQEYPVAATVPVRPVPPAAPAALVAPVLAAPKITQPAAAKTPKAPAAKPSVKSTAAPKAKSTSPAAKSAVKSTAAPKAKSTPPVVKPATKTTTSKPAGKSKTK
jgi:hypothetical protein